MVAGPGEMLKPQLHGRPERSKSRWQITTDTWMRAARTGFERFSQKRLDEANLPNFAAVDDEAVAIVAAAYSQAFAIKKSRADASRLIKQGSVQLDGQKIVDPKAKISLHAGQILRLDKTHAVRIS